MDWTVQSETTGERVNIHPQLHSSHLNTRSQVMDNFFTSAGKHKLALNQVAQSVQPSSVLNASWINKFWKCGKLLCPCCSLSSGPCCEHRTPQVRAGAAHRAWAASHQHRAQLTASPTGRYPGCFETRAMENKKYQSWMVRAVYFKWLIWLFSDSKCSKWTRFTYLHSPE